MTSDRPYRRGKSHSEAIAILKSVCGSEMDPVVVEVFAQLGDQRKQQMAIAVDQSLQSLSQAVAAPETLEANELVVVRESVGG